MRRPTLLNWSLVPVGAGLLLLLVLCLNSLKAPLGIAPSTGPVQTNLPPHPAAERTRQYFGWPSRVDWQPLTNAGNPFFTLAIQPPPPPKPAPPPPTTRKVDLTYRGYLQTSAGIRRAVVQVADKQVLARAGENVVASFNATEIGPNQLLLTSTNPPVGTNPPATVKLDFSKTVPLEVPAK